MSEISNETREEVDCLLLGNPYGDDALDDIIRAARKDVEPRWSPIETAPLGTTILLVTPAGTVFQGVLIKREGIQETHWMPLPAPPEPERLELVEGGKGFFRLSEGGACLHAGDRESAEEWIRKAAQAIEEKRKGDS